MKKVLLRDKIIKFQREILSLSSQLTARERTFQELDNKRHLELLAVLDAFENIFTNIDAKQDSFDKSTKRTLKSFQAIHRKLVRLLEKDGITKIDLTTGKAEIGLCKIVETRESDEMEDGSIISVVRSGYRHGNSIIRPAEVITVLSNNVKSLEN